MKKWNLVIDVAACTNCNNCAVATQDEFAGNSFPGYSGPGAPDVRTLDVDRHVRGEGATVDVHYVPRMCNHCDDAPCMKVGGDAISKRDDGIVIIDPEKGKGRHDLVDACPYGAIKWNDAEQLPQNWIFDAHLIDQGWTEPRAAHVCPTRALRALKLEDAEMSALAQAEGLAVLKPELNTGPRVYYRNLGPALSQFIGGNVTADGGNVEGADVRLLRDGKEIAATETDAFGDFRFDQVANGSAGYSLHAKRDGQGAGQVDIEGAVETSRVVTVVLN